MRRQSDNTLRPPDNPENFRRVAPDLDELVAFDLVTLMNKDSTNMTPSDWRTMAQAVYERLEQGYRGFVIAHGTDTMHFSASAVGFALGRKLNVPVVFNREVAVRPPSGLDAPPKNQWAALCAAHELASKKPSCFVVE